MLLAVSRVHESMPLFIVDGLRRRLGSLRDRKVAVLGLTFKRDSDDTRDSLSDKLIRLLERELAHVARHDPHVPDESEPLETALAGADAVVIATNHSAFETLLPELPPHDAARRPLERHRRRPGVRLRARSWSGPEPASSSPAAPARSARRSCGGCAPTASSVRIADQREPADVVREATSRDLRDRARARDAAAATT